MLQMAVLMQSLASHGGRRPSLKTGRPPGGAEPECEVNPYGEGHAETEENAEPGWCI